VRVLLLAAAVLLVTVAPSGAHARAAADKQAPSVPQGERITGTTSSSIGLAWNASTDNVGVVAYDLFLNDAKVGSTTSTSYTYSGLQCSTTYTVGVEARDAAGNHSDRNYASGTVTTAACASDSTPPSVPSGERITGTTQSSIGLAWNASSDNVGVAAYDVFLNDVKVASVSGSTTNYTYTGLQCGTTYTIGLEARDAAGNHSDRSFASGTASTAACSTSDTQPPSTPGSLSTSSTQTSVTLTWAASSDNVGVAGYDLFNAGSKVGTSSSATYTFTGLACGQTYTVGVDAFDAAGNTSQRASTSAQTAACSTGGGASVFLSPSGSDSAACTQAAPCKSLDRAYHVAKPGQIVELAGGSYAGGSITADSTKTSSTDVLFRPAAGASVSVAGLEIYGSHLEIDNLNFTSWPYVRTRKTADDVTLRNDTAGKFEVLGSSNVSLIGGSYGPMNDDSNNIAPESPSDSKVPTNILLDGVTIHNFHLTNGTAHVDCLHSWGGNGITIRNSVFYDCEVFDILFTVDSVVGTPTNVTIENNFLDCCRGGFFSIYLGDQHGEKYSNYLIRNNSTDKAIGIGTSNIQTISGLNFYGNIAPSFQGCGKTGVTADYNVWYAGSKCGSHDQVAASGFVNPSAHDFHLGSGAAAIDHGDPASYPAKDIDGQARPMGGMPDAGADEHS
jgi:chitodextrinase